MIDPKQLLKSIVPESFRRRLRERYVAASVSQIYGPKKVRLSPNEGIVTCVVKNGDFYLEAFVDHYTRKGFNHIFFLDNGSTDRTIELAQKYENVSICQSRLPIQAFQRVFKKYLAETSGEGGWVLDVDIDEFFDYPFSNVLGLAALLDYLNDHDYTAVMTQMLDMFSNQPLSYLAQRKSEDLRSIYRYYDISNIGKRAYYGSELVGIYGAGNHVPVQALQLYYGGIRKTLYENNCLLTKHSLFRLGHNVDPFLHVHFVNNARLADITCALLHYKLTSNAIETALQNKEHFSTNSKGYSDFIDVLTSHSDYMIKRDTAEEFRSVNQLLDNQFLFASGRYRAYAASFRTACGEPALRH